MFVLQEWGKQDVKGVLGNICGFLTVIGGIFLLNAFRDMSISWRDVSSAAKKAAAPSGSVGGDLADRTERHQLLESNTHEEEDILNEIDSRSNSYSGSRNGINRGDH